MAKSLIVRISDSDFSKVDKEINRLLKTNGIKYDIPREKIEWIYNEYVVDSANTKTDIVFFNGKADKHTLLMASRIKNKTGLSVFDIVTTFEALYNLKHSGKVSHQFFNPSRSKEITKELEKITGKKDKKDRRKAITITILSVLGASATGYLLSNMAKFKKR